MPDSIPEITKRRPGRPKKNTKEASSIISSLFTPVSKKDDNISEADSMDANEDDLQTLHQSEELEVVKEDVVVPPIKENSTWVSKLKPSAKGMSLSFINPSSELVQIDPQDIDSEISFWKCTLVGSFIGTKHSLTSVQSYVKQFWNHVSVPDVLYFKKGWFYFKFANKEDCLSVFHGGPWVFGNSTLILKEWSPDFCAQMESVKVVPVWTLFPDLDPCFWSSTALSKIASVIGRPLFADPYTTEKTRISFARVLIDIDISKDIPSFVKVNTPYGEKVVTVDYEWMPHFCSHCDVIGHSLSKCRKNKVVANVKENATKVWRPVIKENPTTKSQTDLQDSVQVLESTVENTQELTTTAIDKSILLEPDTSQGFTSIRRRSCSPLKTQTNAASVDVQEVYNSNSFSVLAQFEPDDDHNKMERGGASHCPPC